VRFPDRVPLWHHCTAHHIPHQHSSIRVKPTRQDYDAPIATARSSACASELMLLRSARLMESTPRSPGPCDRHMPRDLHSKHSTGSATNLPHCCMVGPP